MGAVVSLLGRRARVLMLDDDTLFADAVNGALYSNEDLVLVGHTAVPKELRLLLPQYAPDVLLVDHSLPTENGLLVAEQIAKDFKDLWVILVTDSPSRQLVNEATSRGIRRIISRPVDYGKLAMAGWAQNELAAAVAGIIEDENRQMELLRRGGGFDDNPRHGVSPEMTPGARVVTVWNPKGGTGKSTIAANLALYAQTNPIQRVQTALVGMDSSSGTISALLGMQPSPTLMDWFDYAGADELDPAAVMQRVARHESNMYVVFEPAIQDLDKLSAGLVKTVIGSLRSAAEAGLVVVDTEPSLLSTEAVGTALDMAHVVLLVVEPTVPCLQRTNEVVSALVKSEMLDPTKLRLVINRQSERPDITMEEITNLLGLQCVGVIAEDPAVRAATNKAEPLAIYQPDGPFMRELKRVAAKVVPALGTTFTTQAPRRKKIFGLF